MFKFPNLIDDFKNLKFDSVSQALSSSQTLVSSFKSSVASVVTKVINQDALIKGQINGPDNLKVQIQDTISDLENMRNSYKINLNTVRDLTVPAFVPSASEAISIRANGDSGLIISRGNVPILRCRLNMSPSQPDVFVQDFQLCTLPADINFIPTISNTNWSDPSAVPQLSAMHRSIQGSDSMVANNAYKAVHEIPSFSRPLWMSIRPIALGNTRPGANKWRDGVITHDPIDIGDGKVAYLNICIVQSVERKSTGSSSAVMIPGIGLLFSVVIADSDDYDLSGEVVYKNASFYKKLNSLNGVSATSNVSSDYAQLRDAVNGTLTINDEWTEHLVIAELDVNAQDPGLRNTFKWDFDSIVRAMAEFATGLNVSAAVIYSVPTSGVVLSQSDAIDQINFDQISIDTATIRTEDGYILSDLKADITSLVGDLTTQMNYIINDLNSAYYE